MMNQLQIYKYATLALLVLNLSLITFFFVTAPPPPHQIGKRAFEERAVEILNLDEQQLSVFLRSASAHGDKMRTINSQQRTLLKLYFQDLVDTSTISNPASILSQVQELEQDKVTSTYLHFEEVKSILTPEQQPGFNAFMDHVMEIILVEK